MTALVRRWRAGTDTQAAFAARYGLSVGTLRYWIRRVSSSDAPVFAPVHVVAPAPEVAAVEVALASGARVIVRDGATVELLQTVLAALRPPC
jgi:hypothetical protein